MTFELFIFSLCFVAANIISFDDPVYIVNENDKLTINLLLSSLLSVDVTVQINSEDVTATGKGSV